MAQRTLTKKQVAKLMTILVKLEATLKDQLPTAVFRRLDLARSELSLALTEVGSA
jgi:hypothetical protein